MSLSPNTGSHMATIWKLTYRGRVIDGVVEPGDLEPTITFNDPSGDGIILCLTFSRACEIASWTGSVQRKRINATLQKIEVSLAREWRDRDRPEEKFCQFCGEVITVIGEDFEIHAIPACRGYKDAKVP